MEVVKARRVFGPIFDHDLKVILPFSIFSKKTIPFLFGLLMLIVILVILPSRGLLLLLLLSSRRWSSPLTSSLLLLLMLLLLLLLLLSSPLLLPPRLPAALLLVGLSWLTALAVSVHVVRRHALAILRLSVLRRLLPPHRRLLLTLRLRRGGSLGLSTSWPGSLSLRSLSPNWRLLLKLLRRWRRLSVSLKVPHSLIGGVPHS